MRRCCIIGLIILSGSCTAKNDVPPPQPAPVPTSAPPPASADDLVIDSLESITPASDTRSCEQDPAFTPDDSGIIYSTFVDGGWGLMRYDVKAKRRTRVTMQNAQVWEYLESFDAAPAVSPDGTRVAYVHRTNQGAELRVLPITGDASADPLTVAAVSAIQYTPPAWTGLDQLLFTDPTSDVVEYRIGPPPVFLRKIVQPQKHYIFTVAQTRDHTIIARVRSFTNLNAYSFMRRGPADKDWSPVPFDDGAGGAMRLDGFAFSRDEKKFYHVIGNTFDTAHIMVRDITGSGGKDLPKIAHVTGGFSISTDRRRLVYSQCFEYSDLVRVRRGQPPTLLLAATGAGGYIQPRGFGGRYVISTTRLDNGSEMNVFDMKTNKVTPVADCDCEAPAVSPDGRYLVYLKHTTASARGGLRLREIKGGDLGDEIILTQDPSDRLPEWFHDSQHVIFKRGGTRGPPIVLQKIAITGDKIVKPLTELGPVALFSVSPAEDRIVFTTKDNTLLTATSRGQKREPLSKTLGSTVIFNRVIFSPDGKRVLILRGVKELVEVNLAGSRDPELVADLGQTDTWAMDYAPDGDGFVVPLSTFKGGMFIAHGHFP